MSEKIADWLIEQKAISTGERELYAYAVHCLFSLLYPIAFASVIGAFLGMPIEAVVMIMSFIAVRKFSGGYHADSFYKCLIISSIVIMTMLQISNYINNNLLFNVIYIASSILLMIFSPIDSANKRLDNDDKRFCKICEQVNRYTGSEPREPEADVLELIDQFGGMLLDRPERIGFKVDEALVLLEYRNLKGKQNRYLEIFKDFVNRMEAIKV